MKNKKFIKLLGFILLTIISVSIISTTIAFATEPQDTDQQIEENTDKGFVRLAGTNRYDTMLQIVEETKNTHSNVVGKPCVLARGDDYPDALAATALAGLFDGSIVLTDAKSSHLRDEAKKAIQALRPSKIYVPGGSLPDNVIKEAIQLTPGCTSQILAGTNRTNTAYLLYQQGLKFKASGGTGWGNTAIISYSCGYADALSVAPLLYKKHYPLFLTDSDKNINNDVIKAIKDGGFSKIYLLGSTDSVSAKVEQDIDNAIGIGKCVRLGGSGRIDTSALIAKNCVDEESMSFEHMTVSWGYDFPDALSVGPFNGKNNSVLMLSGTDSNFENAANAVRDNHESLGKSYVTGSKKSISENVFEKLNGVQNGGYIPYVKFTNEDEDISTLKIRYSSSYYYNLCKNAGYNLPKVTVKLEYATTDPKNDDGLHPDFWKHIELSGEGGYDCGRYGNKEGIVIEQGQSLWFRGINDNLKGLRFCFEYGRISCSGELASLLNYNKINNFEMPNLPPYAFVSMFSGFRGKWLNSEDDFPSRVITSPSLSSTSLSYGCYKNMFSKYGYSGSSMLKIAPKLPAKTLAPECYAYMFNGCASLKNAPRLQANNLSQNCYKEMFCDCLELEGKIELPAKIMKKFCYSGMFTNTKIDEITIQATELADDCFLNMLNNSTVSKINVSFSSWGSNVNNYAQYTQNWLLNVKQDNTCIFRCKSTLPAYRGNSYIPENWIIEPS